MKVQFDKGVHRPNNCSHGPQSWPFWKPLGLAFVRLGVQPPSSGFGLWIYFRKALAVRFDLYVDRRPGK